MNFHIQSYRFIPIERVTFQEAMQLNAVIIVRESNDRVIYQPLNCSPTRFIKYVQDNMHYKLINPGSENNLYEFEKTNDARSI